jgi:hypothetical protein
MILELMVNNWLPNCCLKLAQDRSSKKRPAAKKLVRQQGISHGAVAN